MWKMVKLGDVCKITNGSTPLRKEKRYWAEGNIPWFTIDDLRVQGKNITYTKQNVTQAAVDDKKVKLVPVNSVLLCCTASIGAAAIARVEMATNQQFNALTPKSAALNSDYLYFVATTLTQTLLSVSGSTTINFVSMSKLKEISIPLPPLAEQERIVAKLDAAFAEIDEAVELGQERLSRAEKALGQIVDNELSELREENESCSLGEMLESVEYGTSTKCSKTGKYPVLRMGNMQTGSFVMDDLVYLDSDKELEKYRVRKGDVFFNRTNSALHVGKAAIYDGGSDCLFAGYLIRLNYSDDLLDGRFLNYYLNAPSTRAYGYSVMTSSVNQSNINGTKLKEYPFIKVDLKTQHCIRKKLDEITALLSQLHFLLGKSLSEYAQLKSAILKQELQSSEAA